MSSSIDDEVIQLRARLAHEVKEREWFANWHSKLSEMTLEENETKLRTAEATRVLRRVVSRNQHQQRSEAFFAWSAGIAATTARESRKRAAVANLLDRWRCASALARCAELERDNRALADERDGFERRFTTKRALRSLSDAQSAMVASVESADRTLQRSRAEEAQHERLRDHCISARRGLTRQIVLRLRRGQIAAALRTWRASTAATSRRESTMQKQRRALGAMHNARVASAWRVWTKRSAAVARQSATTQRELRRIVRLAWLVPVRGALRTWHARTLQRAAVEAATARAEDDRYEGMAQSQLEELLRQHRVHVSRVTTIHSDELDTLRESHGEAVAELMRAQSLASARHRAREEKANARADAAAADAAQQRRVVATVTRECDERIEVVLRRHAAEKAALLDQMRTAYRKSNNHVGSGSGRGAAAVELRDWQKEKIETLRDQEESVRRRMESISSSLDALRQSGHTVPAMRFSPSPFQLPRSQGSARFDAAAQRDLAMQR